MKRNKLYYIFESFRVNQWIKNLVVYTAIVFSGKLFDPQLFISTTYAFLTFVLLSSVSYVLNDIIDFEYDKKHPVKKFRPIASGKVSIQEATFLVFILVIIALIISLFFSLRFFMLSVFFVMLHFLYSLYLKKFAVIDILSISFSFMIRAFAGEIVTGFHIPIWLILTIFFGSLFIASVKRHAEYVIHGLSARSSLYSYKEHMLNFLTNTFATTTIISYSLYAYLERIPSIATPFNEYFSRVLPEFEARRWLMVTIPFVVYGISRYAQLLYTKDLGERPEKLITKDLPLIATIFLWGATIILLIYVL
ncbi:MAG: UbiA prenyltransferase family protein [bacterium]|nr:UbiA prenyltransferase family protein [bacterium]